MDFIEELKPTNIYQKTDDEAWKNYATFIDSMVAFFENDTTTQHFVPWLDELLQSNDLNQVVNQLCENNIFKNALSEYFEEVFPMNVMKMDFSKNHIEAIRLFKEATNRFDHEDFEQALGLLSKAICLSEQESSDYLLPILFDKRSIVFYCLKQYYDCILDIQELMFCNIPSSKTKLFIRMAQAAVSLNDWDNVEMLEKIFNDCSQALSNMSNKKEAIQMKNLLTKMEITIDKLKFNQKQEQNDSKNSSNSQLSLDFDFPDKNEFIRGVSNKLALSVFDGKNRGYKAAQDIEDEFLFVEDPFTFHYFGSTNDFYCANCFRRLCHNVPNDNNLNNGNDNKANNYNQATFGKDKNGFHVIYNSFVPCYSCNKFIFCNKNCRDEAYNRFHKHECHKFMFALESHIGIAYLVARLICSAYEEVLQTISLLNNSADGINSNISKSIDSIVEMPYDGNYGCILKLMNHSEEHDSKSKICFILTAFFLCQCFEKMQLFTKQNQPNEYILVKLLIHHLQQLSSNVVTIFEQVLVTENLSSSMEIPIGVGLYANISLLNHSCDPDLIPIYAGSKILLKAIRPISTGDEVCFSYGPSYFTMNYTKRQKWLQEQYFFTCKCNACLEKKENYDHALLCPTCNGPAFIEKEPTTEKLYMFCRNEHRIADLEPIFKQIKQGLEHQKAGAHFLKQGLHRKDDDDLVASLVSFYKADVIFTNTLYCLNRMWIQLKSQMIDCYLKMGHNDRAAIYCRQIIGSYSKYAKNRDLIIPSIREWIRLIKIYWLLVDELFQSNDSSSTETKMAASNSKQEKKKNEIQLGQYLTEIESGVNYCLQHVKFMSQSDIDFLNEQQTKINDYYQRLQ